MTAGSANCDGEVESEDVVLNRITFPPAVNNIIDHLSLIKKITFKSQQIDDPELKKEEKIEIAKQILEKSRYTFLMRFGGYMEQNHLEAFGKMYLENDKDEEGKREEILLLLENLKENLKSRRMVVKNRRFAAMQDLLKKGDYFSEIEMMRRAPELYEELIGQYLTQKEKKERDSYDVKNTTFSGILMHTMDRQEMHSIMEEVAKKNTKEREAFDKVSEKPNQLQNIADNLSSNEDSNSNGPFLLERDDDFDDVPMNCRHQWGNFDNEQISCSSSSKPKQQTLTSENIKKKVKSQDVFILGGERDLLRQEFLGIMQQNFLSGEDKEFDYEAVDNDSRLDDLKLYNQDKEDAYFEESDDSTESQKDSILNEQPLENNESEDELDIYMKHLNQHHSLKIN